MKYLLAYLAATAPLLLTGCKVTGRGNGCPANCKVCSGDGKCMDCTPGENACSGESVAACNDDGTIGPIIKGCDTSQGSKCGHGDCLSACEAAAAEHSYLGCDYWPTTTLNAQL